MSGNIEEEGDQQDLVGDSASSEALFEGSGNLQPTKFSRSHTLLNTAWRAMGTSGHPNSF